MRSSPHTCSLVPMARVWLASGGWASRALPFRGSCRMRQFISHWQQPWPRWRPLRSAGSTLIPRLDELAWLGDLRSESLERMLAVQAFVLAVLAIVFTRAALEPATVLTLVLHR